MSGSSLAAAVGQESLSHQWSEWEIKASIGTQQGQATSMNIWLEIVKMYLFLRTQKNKT